jgi:two-component system sensor histidine kinase AlgZ
LPPELPWLYLFLPLPAAFLVGGNLLQESSPELQHALIKMYVPWLAYGVAYQLVYNHNRLVPRALEALSRWQRLLFHVGVICVVTPVAALGIVPLLEWLCGETMNRGDFLTVSFIFSSASLFPSLAVQSLRVRAQAAEQKAQLERRAALEAQLQALQARTDPHFLFNSLNTVASLIPEDPELAERTLERLADLFRYALDSSASWRWLRTTSRCSLRASGNAFIRGSMWTAGSATSRCLHFCCSRSWRTRSCTARPSANADASRSRCGANRIR